MIIKNAEFTISATNPKQYPKDNLPQIVLVGKSNVGKSSFINTMVNRKKLARTSSEPGKTRLINFYKVSIKQDQNLSNEACSAILQTTTNSNSNEFYFVDLPGYGFSKMSKSQQVEVGNFIEEYLKKCPNISLILFLVDIRHNPTSNDKLMYDYIISQNLPCIIIANKADKIAITKVLNTVKNIQDTLNPLHDLKFMPFSSERKIYSEDLWNEILKRIS